MGKAPKAVRKATKPKKALRKTVRKATKPKKAKKITKKMQTGSMIQVWNGTKLYTKGGLMKKDLMKSKKNKIVSKKAYAAGKKSFKGIKKWLGAVNQARAELKITGFVRINKGAQGIKLYQRAKAIYGN